MRIATLPDSLSWRIGRLIPRDLHWGFGSCCCVAGRNGKPNNPRPIGVSVNGREVEWGFAHVELLGFGIVAAYEFPKGRPFVRVALHVGLLRVRYREPS